MINKLVLGGIVGSAVSVSVAYGVASLPCPLASKPADKVCYVRAFNKSLDAWKIGCLGGVIIGVTVGGNKRLSIKFQPIHLSMIGVLVLVSAVAVNSKTFGFGVTQPQISTTTNSNLSPRMRAFLATIRWAETGTSDESSYTKLVFNGRFNNNFATHPRIKQCASINGKRVCSTAAGGYQMLDISWDDVAPDLGLKDFSPPSQDKMAIEYIRRNNAIRDIEGGNVETAFCKVGKIWASLICNNYGQNPKSLEQLKNYYNKQLVAYGR